MVDSLNNIRTDCPSIFSVCGTNFVSISGPFPLSATVLLVEDDAMVRECLRALLDDVGGRIIDVANAAEALKWMAIDGVPNVLVTDLQLGPGMNGLALIAAARLQWPGMRAVLMSCTDMPEPLLHPGDRFLRKPFGIDTLARIIAELVAEQDWQ